MIKTSDDEALNVSVATIKGIATAALDRTASYAEFVATLIPGTSAHRAASEALFLMQDSAFVLQQTLEAILRSA